MLIWVKPKDLSWGSFLHSTSFFYMMVGGATTDCTLLDPQRRLSRSPHKMSLTQGLVSSCSMDLCICLEGLFAFDVCLLFCIVISAFCFGFVSHYPFRLNSPHFEDSRNAVKIVLGGSHHFQARWPFRVSNQHTASSGRLSNVLYSGFVVMLLVAELARNRNSQRNGT